MAEKPTYEELEKRIQELEKNESKRNQGEDIIQDGQYRWIVEDANELILVAQDGLIRFINQKAFDYLGYSPEELKDRPFIQYIYPEDREKVSERHLKRLKGEDLPIVYPFRVVDRDGKVRWVEINAVISEWNGKPATLNYISDITERKRAEDGLRILMESVENSSDAIGMSSPEGTHYYQNKVFDELFGTIGEHPPETLYVDPAVGHEVFKTIMGGGQWSGEVQMYAKDKGILTIFLRAYASKDRAGKISALVGVHTDITNRKEAEEKLERQHVFLQGVINSIPGILYLFPLTENPKMVLWNDTLRTITEYTDKEIGQMNPMQFMEPRFFEIIGEKMKEVLEKGSAIVEATFVRKDGSCIPMLLTGRLLTIDGIHYDVGVGVDITERKQMEMVLRESELTFRKLFEESSDAILLIDETGVFVECNQAALDLLKMTREQFLFQPPVKISPEFQPNGLKSKESALEMIELAYKKGLHRFDWTCVNSQGREFIVDVSLMPIVIKGKTMLHTTWRNITERKQAEAEKLIAQKNADDNEKMALVGQIAGKMAHDFNNILGIIMGNTELSLLDCKDDKIKKTLELIYEQTIRGRNLTKNLVAFAKDQEPKQEFFSINDKMDLVVNLLKKDLDGIKVVRQYGRGIPELLADPGMMEHSIVNLIQNSIHALSLVEQPEIVVSTYHQGEFIFLEIEDNGCGIPLEFLGEIFKPSFTLKGSKDKNGMYKPGIKGTGYGMPNVKRYIEQHKGDISIRSEIQKGTKVIIRMPVIKKELTTDEIKEIEKETIYFEKYILIVEDEQAISDIQYRILTHEPCNHKVDIANNGEVAIDLLNRNEYDLVSLDYVLPGKFNGMDVYHHLRKKNKTAPVLFISGNIEFLESIKDLKQKDFFIDHLSKPCKNIDYVNGINKLFGIVVI